MPHLNRDGVRIYYEVHGAKNDKPTLLLSHGYSATHAMWQGQLDSLKGYQVVTWDMRGHGDSDSPDDASLYSEAHTVADMAALLDEVSAQRAVIAGLSLGGYMSLAFHVAHRPRIRALMLFDTGPGYRSDSAREDWNKTAVTRAETLERDGLSSLGRGDEVKLSTHRSAKGLALAARGMLAQFDARIMESLADIAVPTLVLVGANDKPYLAATDYMVRKIPGAAKVVIDDAGHASNIHQPRAFNRAMTGFLSSLPQ